MRILHVFRSPVGGLFRHVRDLAKCQSAMGHQVGLVCDSGTGGATAAALLEDCKTFCALGISTLSIPRLPAPADIRAIAEVTTIARASAADVIHCHGAKGGLIGRIAGWRLGITSVYCPHGGSLHYHWASPSGAAFLSTEKLLARVGSGFVFVCDFERKAFAAKIGLANRPAVTAHNGLWPAEFAIPVLSANPTDLLFVGEVRHLKGIDLLLNAVASLKPQRSVTLTVVGDGPELAAFRAMSTQLGLDQQVNFVGRKTMQEALPLGRVMVVPSRNESFPYVVLEAAAASKPLIATHVGGIPEILPSNMMCASNADAIASQVSSCLSDLPTRQHAANQLAKDLQSGFSVQHMVGTITRFYETLMAARTH
jgi:glycosyltransferase involved in cell wall biosynthesis